MECQSASSAPEFLAFGHMAVLALATLVLTFRLRVARVQVIFRIKYCMYVASVCGEMETAPTPELFWEYIYFIAFCFSP